MILIQRPQINDLIYIMKHGYQIRHILSLEEVKKRASTSIGYVVFYIFITRTVISKILDSLFMSHMFTVFFLQLQYTWMIPYLLQRVSIQNKT